MVSQAESTTVLVTCECGKELEPKGMTGHLRSKAHNEWADAHRESDDQYADQTKSAPEVSLDEPGDAYQKPETDIFSPDPDQPRDPFSKEPETLERPEPAPEPEAVDLLDAPQQPVIEAPIPEMSAEQVLANPKLLAQVMALTNAEPVYVEPELTKEEEVILQRAREYQDPIQIARDLRRLFDQKRWPDNQHRHTQLEWLKAHNIPIRTMPRHLDPDATREYMNAWYDELRERGWGTEAWEIK